MGGGVEAWPFSDGEAVKPVNARGEAETRPFFVRAMFKYDEMKD